jgi:hypothetical protein
MRFGPLRVFLKRGGHRGLSCSRPPCCCVAARGERQRPLRDLHDAAVVVSLCQSGGLAGPVVADDGSIREPGLLDDA